MSFAVPAGGWEIKRGDEDYPDTLEDLSSPPDVIYGLGDPRVLACPSLAIVGARRATPYGLAIAEMAARVASECNVVVVSGGRWAASRRGPCGALVWRQNRRGVGMRCRCGLPVHVA